MTLQYSRIMNNGNVFCLFTKQFVSQERFDPTTLELCTMLYGYQEAFSIKLKKFSKYYFY